MNAAVRVGWRILGGFLAGLAFWLALSRPYERILAAGAEFLIRAFESPAATRLEARPGEFVVRRSDWPPASPSPGLPADDLHFNFVLLAALFAAGGGAWRSGRVAAFGVACAVLFLVHLTALVFEVHAVYATRLGEWSQTHYGPFARNFWAAGYHFYVIAGRFAAPFVIWWPLRGGESEGETRGTAWRRRHRARKDR
jgi:hypothetical protein